MENLQNFDGKDIVPSASDKPSQVPEDTLLTIIENSGVLEQFPIKIDVRELALVILFLAPFAPMEVINPNDPSIEWNLRNRPSRILLLHDGTIIQGTFDFNAFRLVCLDHMPYLTEEEAKTLYEQLKKFHIIEHVYQMTAPLPLPDTEPIIMNMTGDAVQISQELFAKVSKEDTDGAALPSRVREVLLATWESLEHGQRFDRFDRYFETLDEARRLFRNGDQDVVFFLKEKDSENIYTHILRSSQENPSGEEILEVSLYHGLRSSFYYPDTYDSLLNILREGFSSQVKVHQSQGPNVFIGLYGYDPNYESVSPKTGDRYMLQINGAKEIAVGRAILQAHRGEQVEIPDPFFLTESRQLALASNVPPKNITVHVKASRQSDKEAFYQKIFQEFPAVEYEITYIN